MSDRKRNEMLFRIGDAEPKTQKELEEKVFRFTRQMLEEVEGYAVQFAIQKSSVAVAMFSAKEGIPFSAIVSVLKTYSIKTGDYPVRDDMPRTESYTFKDTDFSWQIGYWLEKESGAYSYDIVFDIRDRKRLEGYLDAHQGIEYAVYPQAIKKYKSFSFNFTNGDVLKNGKLLTNLMLGTRQAKLAQLLLDNRGKKFQLSELIDFLGDGSVNRIDAEKNVKKAFDELTKKGITKVFVWNKGYFVKPE